MAGSNEKPTLTGPEEIAILEGMQACEDMARVGTGRLPGFDPLEEIDEAREFLRETLRAMTSFRRRLVRHAAKGAS